MRFSLRLLFVLCNIFISQEDWKKLNFNKTSERHSIWLLLPLLLIVIIIIIKDIILWVVFAKLNGDPSTAMIHFAGIQSSQWNAQPFTYDFSGKRNLLACSEIWLNCATGTKKYFENPIVWSTQLLFPNPDSLQLETRALKRNILGSIFGEAHASAPGSLFECMLCHSSQLNCSRRIIISSV